MSFWWQLALAVDRAGSGGAAIKQQLALLQQQQRSSNDEGVATVRSCMMSGEREGGMHLEHPAPGSRQLFRVRVG